MSEGAAPGPGPQRARVSLRPLPSPAVGRSACAAPRPGRRDPASCARPPGLRVDPRAPARRHLLAVPPPRSPPLGPVRAPAPRTYTGSFRAAPSSPSCRPGGPRLGMFPGPRLELGVFCPVRRWRESPSRGTRVGRCRRQPGLVCRACCRGAAWARRGGAVGAQLPVDAGLGPQLGCSGLSGRGLGSRPRIPAGSSAAPVYVGFIRGPPLPAGAGLREVAWGGRGEARPQPPPPGIPPAGIPPRNLRSPILWAARCRWSAPWVLPGAKLLLFKASTLPGGLGLQLPAALPTTSLSASEELWAQKRLRGWVEHMSQGPPRPPASSSTCKRVRSHTGPGGRGGRGPG